MAARIDVDDGVIESIAVAIQALRIGCAWNKRIWRDESRQLGVIIPTTVVVKAALRVEFLSGEAAGRIGIPFRPRAFSPGLVLVELDLEAGIVRKDDA